MISRYFRLEGPGRNQRNVDRRGEAACHGVLWIPVLCLPVSAMMGIHVIIAHHYSLCRFTFHGYLPNCQQPKEKQILAGHSISMDDVHEALARHSMILEWGLCLANFGLGM